MYSLSNELLNPVCYCFTEDCSCVITQLSDSFAAPWTAACQALLSMGFPRQEYLSEVPFSSPGALLSPGINSTFPALAGGFFTTEPFGKPLLEVLFINNHKGYIEFLKRFIWLWYQSSLIRGVWKSSFFYFLKSLRKIGIL